MTMMTPKYIDVALIIFLTYFTINRFMEGHTWIGVMLTVLTLMNVLVLFMKIKQDKVQRKDAK